MASRVLDYKMWMLFVSCLVVTISASTISAPKEHCSNNNSRNNTAQPVNVGVYFESRCPDSRRFIQDQLIVAYKKLGDIMEMRLVPFGKARVTEKGAMICQHGTRECEGNKLIACVQDRAKGKNLEILETIGCLFDNIENPKECLTKYLPNVSYDDVEKCQKSDESTQMMREFEKLTGRLTYVPKITINNQYSAEIQSECEQRLEKCVCENYQGSFAGCEAEVQGVEPTTGDDQLV